MARVTHWEYETPACITDSEFGTALAAKASALEAFVERLGNEEPLVNSQVYTEECLIYGMDHEGDIIETLEEELEYEHYHGDLQEHGLRVRDVL